MKVSQQIDTGSHYVKNLSMHPLLIEGLRTSVFFLSNPLKIEFTLEILLKYVSGAAQN